MTRLEELKAAERAAAWAADGAYEAYQAELKKTLEELKAVKNAQKKTNGADMPVYTAELNIMLEASANTSLEADNMFEAIYDDCVVALGDACGMVTLSSAVTDGQKETPELGS